MDGLQKKWRNFFRTGIVSPWRMNDKGNLKSVWVEEFNTIDSDDEEPRNTLSTTEQYHATLLRYIGLHNTTLHYTTLHYITLHNTTLHYTTKHNTAPHYTTHELTVGDWKDVAAVSLSSSLSLLLFPFSLLFVLSALSSCFWSLRSASSSAVLIAMGRVRPARPSKSSFLR